jgi:chromate reductase, NAD(P)H dehydrogenase (quinone)
MQVLALSGSLRAASINTALLHVAARLAPAGMNVEVFGGIAEVPLFNIDLEQAVPTSVAALRAAVASADALLIASPEYAHGVSGVMKNTLDWLVSLESFVGKPVALLNAQPRAQFSDPALREILTTMSADLILPASVSLKLSADTLTEVGMLASESVCAALSTALAALHSRYSQPTAHVHAVYPLDSASGLAGRQGLEVAGQ